MGGPCRGVPTAGLTRESKVSLVQAKRWLLMPRVVNTHSSLGCSTAFSAEGHRVGSAPAGPPPSPARSPPGPPPGTSGRGHGDQDERVPAGALLLRVLQLLGDRGQDVLHRGREAAADGDVRVVGHVHAAENWGEGGGSAPSTPTPPRALPAGETEARSGPWAEPERARLVGHGGDPSPPQLPPQSLTLVGAPKCHPGLQAGVDASEMPEQRLHLLVRGRGLVGHSVGAQDRLRQGPGPPGCPGRPTQGSLLAGWAQGGHRGTLRVGTGGGWAQGEGGHRGRVGTRVQWGGVRGCAGRGDEGAQRWM